MSRRTTRSSATTTQSPPAYYAYLVCGATDAAEDNWMYRDLAYCYWFLLRQGFSSDHIRVFTSVSMSDVTTAVGESKLYFAGRNHYLVWDATTGKTFDHDVVADEGLGDLVEDLLSGTSSYSFRFNEGMNDTLLLFFFGHGNSRNGSLQLGIDQKLSAIRFRDLISSLERNVKVATYIASCFSLKLISKVPEPSLQLIDKVPEPSLQQGYMSAAASQVAYSPEKSDSGHIYGSVFLQAFVSSLQETCITVPAQLESIKTSTAFIQEGAYVHASTLKDTEIAEFFSRLDSDRLNGTSFSVCSGQDDADLEEPPTKKQRHGACIKWRIIAHGPAQYLQELGMPFAVELPKVPCSHINSAQENFKQPAAPDVGLATAYLRKDVDEKAAIRFTEIVTERQAMIVGWAEIALALYRRSSFDEVTFKRMFEEVRELQDPEIGKIDEFLQMIEDADEGLLVDSRGPWYCLFPFWGLFLASQANLTLEDLRLVLRDRKLVWNLPADRNAESATVIRYWPYLQTPAIATAQTRKRSAKTHASTAEILGDESAYAVIHEGRTKYRSDEDMKGQQLTQNAWRARWVSKLKEWKDSENHKEERLRRVAVVKKLSERHCEEFAAAYENLKFDGQLEGSARELALLGVNLTTQQAERRNVARKRKEPSNRG
ncbi:hypothetical protein HDU85_005874 [Gaertneriomyces sp. JEL0708]|nr:hypothetical protein HDU85_005874 [Gaertneriomyces sp. JEL0708]